MSFLRDNGQRVWSLYREAPVDDEAKIGLELIPLPRIDEAVKLIA